MFVLPFRAVAYRLIRAVRRHVLWSEEEPLSALRAKSELVGFILYQKELRYYIHIL